MFTKTSIALAIIVAICSGAVAAEKRQNGAYRATIWMRTAAAIRI
jgi:hypothetical protein